MWTVLVIISKQNQKEILKYINESFKIDKRNENYMFTLHPSTSYKQGSGIEHKKNPKNIQKGKWNDLVNMQQQ